MRLRPDTFVLTLPDGQRVVCWRRDARAIREDVALTGNVFLRRPDGSEVYERVAPESLEAAALTPRARHVADRPPR